ncbi:MAG: hypothetical protein OXG82_14575 [Gammaproteobacteria bacterium]|nr:hypothetical protein [Gammaproteobacteria bacterium]
MLGSTVAAPAGGDPLHAYRTICREPAAAACARLQVDDRRAACDAEQVLDPACTAYLEELARRERPSREERLVLIRGRSWVNQLRDELTEEAEEALCSARRALAQDHPGYAEAWYEVARCAEDAVEQTALLEKALVVDPANASALGFLTGLVEHTGRFHGIEPRRLVRYQTTGYETASDDRMKITYARRIYRTSLALGDLDAARAIRQRVRRDVLDRLDYHGERGAQSVDLACSTFEIGLGESCIAAFESLARRGELTDDIVHLLPHLLSILRREPDELVLDGRSLPIDAAVRHEYIARLGRAMDAQPVGLRTSEYHRMHAEFLQGPERIGALRQAVAADYGNADAKCALGGALMRLRAYGDARAVYAGMAAADERGGWCDPHEKLAEASRRSR